MEITGRALLTPMPELSFSSSSLQIQIKIGDKVKVKWGDGSIYPASVLDVRQGVAKILPDGYPKGYEIWITADELVNNLNTSQMTASTVAATSGTMEGKQCTTLLFLSCFLTYLIRHSHLKTIFLVSLILFIHATSTEKYTVLRASSCQVSSKCDRRAQMK